MTPDPRSTLAAPLPAVAISPLLAAWLAPFRDSFAAAVWPRVLVLIAGAILAPGQRTVSAALRVMGLADRPGFGRYHEVLSEARWDSRALARTPLRHLLDRLLPEGEVVIVPDDSIERRWGPHIRDRGIYRDPVRSGPTPPAQPTRPEGLQRPSPAQAHRRAGQPGHAVDTGVGERVVWRGEPRAGDRLRHRDLVPRRPAAGAKCGRRLMAHRCP